MVPEGMNIPPRKVVVGCPARIVKDVSPEMLQWKKKGTEIYQALPADLHNTLKPCEPLTSVPKFRKPQAEFFHTWKTVKK
jgi:phenylacetic acid degradation protein/carnitine operon protein CaiE